MFLRTQRKKKLVFTINDADIDGLKLEEGGLYPRIKL